jgi:hydrogenase expression/formation protein HypD
MSAPYRNGTRVRALAEEIARLDPGRPVRLMHVCGTHENALCRHGLRDLLPPWLTLVAGPGCPVCVCPPGDIDLAVRLAVEAKVVLTTFGDVVRVPARQSLADARALGADVRIVYGVWDAVKMARDAPEREVVFFAVGFETTACTVAAVLRDDPPPNFSVLVSHRLVPPALDALLDRPDVTLDGFLLPGHVTTVTGLAPYRELCTRRPLPMVTGGFEPVDVMVALRELATLATRGEARVRNAYGRAVREGGNPEALAAMDAVFEVRDASWRGIGTIPISGLGLREGLRHMDAGERFGLAVDKSIPDTAIGCRCGDVLLGLVEPEECALFGVACTPDEPVGACMVGFEGTCHARFRHARGTA